MHILRRRRRRRRQRDSALSTGRRRAVHAFTCNAIRKHLSRVILKPCSRRFNDYLPLESFSTPFTKRPFTCIKIRYLTRGTSTTDLFPLSTANFEFRVQARGFQNRRDQHRQFEISGPNLFVYALSVLVWYPDVGARPVQKLYTHTNWKCWKHVCISPLPRFSCPSAQSRTKPV